MEERFRELALDRLGSWFGGRLSDDFLKTLPRKVLMIQVPKEWNFGKLDWSGHEDAKYLRDAREARQGGFAAAMFAGVAGCVLGGIGIGLGWQPQWLPFASFGFAAFSFAFPTILQGFWRRRLRRNITKEEMLRAIAEEPLNQAEHRYIELLDEAMRTDNPERENDIRRILRSCAEVVGRFRELEVVYRDLPASPSETAMKARAAEIERLKERLEAEEDFIVKSALQDQIVSLRSLNENLQEVNTLGRRIRTQMDTIVTMLDGARASLARIRLSKGTVADQDSAELIDRLNRLSIESASLEKAMVEVHQFGVE